MPLSEDLKPCPFCGGEAESEWYRDYRHIRSGEVGRSIAVYCTACHADMTICRADVPELSAADIMATLIEAWNTRSEQRSKAEASLGGEGFSSSSADSATRRPSDGCDTEAQSPAGARSPDAMIHVYRLPPRLTAGFCHGGGNPIEFLNVDWFNAEPPLGIDTPPPSEADLRQFIRAKGYYHPAARFLVLDDRSGRTFTIEPELS